MSDWKALVKDVVSKLSIEALRDIVYNTLTSKEEDISSEDSTCSVNSFGSKTWKNKKGELHRIDGPAIENSDGSKYWFVNDKLHREDGPALITADGTKNWYLNGDWMTEQEHKDRTAKEDSTCSVSSFGNKVWRNKKCEFHRIDGPAIEYASGTKEWWVNGKLHRIDGPAIESFNGSKFWYKNGLLHRTDGPACESASGRQYWYLNGEKMTEEEFDKAAK